MNKLAVKNIYLLFTLIIMIVCSCNQANNNDKKTLIKQKNSVEKPATTNQNLNTKRSTEEIDDGEQWLKNLFKCKNGNKYCFYLATEDEVCTKRFYQFMIDSEELFGASNLTEEEYPNAVKKYKEKWEKIYPLRTETEPWLFGRGQDDMENIIDVKVSKISDLNYFVIVDFGEDMKTKSKVTLVKNQDDFKIDYSETVFLNQ
ncbi:hypothetical protein GJU39_10710 [Pedobacter petrophilus]|uniref:Lipoprotein n=2 Tax=Pedobacter petrophilus TaxID=1908241 RepID=A0A7K0FY81_9SPHI|nr:hypothetical protein [Pedobacter petrophilus]MRX76563.1 hypothetical protein [Pedobacter petrophilus]